MKKLIIAVLLILSPVTFSFGQNQPEFSVVMRDFKGLSSKVSPYDLKQEYATRCENVRFSKYGSLIKRDSRSKYNGTTLGATHPVNYLTRYYYGASSKKLIIGYDTFLKSGTDSNGTFANIQTGLTADLHFTSAVYKDMLYLGNGTDSNQRYDGTTCRAMGCTIPASAPTLADGGAGAMAAGTYKYKITFVYDSYQESNAQSTEASITQGASKQVALSAIPTGTAGYGVTARKIYRTEAAGSVYYYLATISDNTTTTYADNTADAGLTLTSTVPTDNSTVAACKYFLLHQDRLFTAGNSTYKSRLYFSHINDGTSYPDIFPASNYLDISKDDGDKIMALAHDPAGVLTVFKQNTIRKIYTEGATAQWTISDPLDFSGCIAPYTVAETPYGIIYLARAGYGKKELRLFNGQSSKSLSEPIEPTLQGISDTYIANAVGVFHENRYYLSFTDKSIGGSLNNNVLVYDFEAEAWSADAGKDISSFCVLYGSADWGELYSGGSNDGFVYIESSANSDLYVRLKSEFDAGTFSQAESAGTQDSPYVILTAADLANDTGAQVASTLSSNAASTYSAETDTAWPSGTWISAATEINARALKYLYWKESLGSQGNIQFWIKTAASSAGLAAASWNGPYTNPDGSDISAVTANVWIQVKARLYIEVPAQASTCKLYRDDYAVWANAGLGTPAETAINLIHESGELDLGYPQARKRFRQLRAKYEGGDSSFTIYYQIDGDEEQSFSIDLGDYPTNYKINFPAAYAFGERIKFRIDESSARDFEFKELTLIGSVEPITY